MNPIVVALLAAALAPKLSPTALAERVNSGLREYLRLPPQTRSVVEVETTSRSTLLGGRADALRIRVYDLDLNKVRLPAAAPAGPQGNLRGSIGEAVLDFPNAVLGPLRVNDISLRAHGLSFNLGRLAAGGGISSVEMGSTEVELVIAEWDLGALIEETVKDLSEVRVSIGEGNEFTAEARAATPLGGMPLRVSGRLELFGTAGLRLAEIEVQILGAALPKVLADRLISRIPLEFAPTAGTPLERAITVTSLTTTRGFVHLAGIVDVAALQQAMSEESK